LIGLLPSCSRGKTPPTVAQVGQQTAAWYGTEYGIASWYGDDFHGRQTANGEVYNMFQLTAAHRSAPLGIHAIVTNLQTGRSVRVRVNDRGPFVDDRILDLSYAAARRLGMVVGGLAPVKITFLPETIPMQVFIVQAGAYTDRNKALRAQHDLTAHHPQVWIAVARDGPQTFYRVRLGAFSSRTDAEQAVHRVQTLGYEASILSFTLPADGLKQPASKF
jgi:rare lipoprotein A